MKCILLNKQPRDISLARFRYQICRVYQPVNDACYYFSKNMTIKSINQ